MAVIDRVPNVIFLSGDRHEFAAVQLRGKAYEFSTSPLSQFYVPYTWTLKPERTRYLPGLTKTPAADGGSEPEEVLLKVGLPSSRRSVGAPLANTPFAPSAVSAGRERQVGQPRGQHARPRAAARQLPGAPSCAATPAALRATDLRPPPSPVARSCGSTRRWPGRASAARRLPSHDNLVLTLPLCLLRTGSRSSASRSTARGASSSAHARSAASSRCSSRSYPTLRTPAWRRRLPASSLGQQPDAKPSALSPSPLVPLLSSPCRPTGTLASSRPSGCRGRARSFFSFPLLPAALPPCHTPALPHTLLGPFHDAFALSSPAHQLRVGCAWLTRTRTHARAAATSAAATASSLPDSHPLPSTPRSSPRLALPLPAPRRCCCPGSCRSDCGRSCGSSATTTCLAPGRRPSTRPRRPPSAAGSRRSGRRRSTSPRPAATCALTGRAARAGRTSTSSTRRCVLPEGLPCPSRSTS